MWHREPAVEQLMDSMKLKWNYVTGIQISKINVKESAKINPRVGEAVDEELINQHHYRMSHGVKFPATVLYDGGTMIAGGNHRIGAAIKTGLKAVDAYVIQEATSEQIYEFIRRDNVRHGKNLSDDQKVRVCVEQHRKFGTPLKVLVDHYFGGDGKWYTIVCNANRAQEVRERLLDLKLPAGYSDSTLATLHPIAEDRNVLREIGQLAAEHGLTTLMAGELLKQVQEKPTEAERVEVVKGARAALKHKEAHPAYKPEVALRRELVRMQKFVTAGNEGAPFPPIDKLAGSADDKKELKSFINDIINSLKRLKDKI